MQPISDAVKTLIDQMTPVSYGSGYSLATILRNLADALQSFKIVTPASQDAVAADAALFDGLMFTYKGGKAHNLAGAIVPVEASEIEVDDATTNYIELDPTDGTVSTNASSFTAGKIPLYTAVTVAGEITTVTDKRARLTAINASETIAGVDFVRALARIIALEPTFTIGTETSDVIQVSFTLDDPFASAPAVHGEAYAFEIFLADAVNGWESSTAPDTGFTVTTGTELKAPTGVRKIVRNTAGASGVTVDIEHAGGAKTWYLGVIVNGLIYYSSAITFA